MKSIKCITAVCIVSLVSLCAPMWCMADEASDNALSSALDSITEAASSVIDKVQDVAGTASEAVTDLANTASDAIKDLSDALSPDGGQNPALNYTGDYVWARARANVSAEGDDRAVINISWSSSAFEHAEWTMSGVLDSETLALSYSDCVKKIITYDMDSDPLVDEPAETIEYTDGTGTIFFNADNTFTWADDQENIAQDAVFEYLYPIVEETLTHNMTYGAKYIMYVGTNDKDTYEPVMALDEAKELANNICAKYTSGYTQLDAKGGWLDDNGVLTQENTLVYIFFDATEQQLQNIMDELISELNQSSILIEKQDVLYTFYSAE